MRSVTRSWRGVGAACLIAGALCASAPAAAQRLLAEELPCALAAPDARPKPSADGKVRIALLVGVNDYVATRNLLGPVNDVMRMYRLLTAQGATAAAGPGQFPVENVCVLTNAEATYAEVKKKFDDALVRHAAGAEQAVFYYAGHGSQLPDDNRDEPDGFDESLFVHDSLPKPGPQMRFNQLRDDELNGMLQRLYAKTRNVVVIMDSCHSGTASRDVTDGEARARYVAPDPDVIAAARRGEPTQGPGAGPLGDGDGAGGVAEFTPAAFPGAVFLSAARDEEPSWEVNGAGQFTTALVNIMEETRGAATYDQILSRTAAELALKKKPHTPVLSGDGGKRAFSTEFAYQPRFDWTVTRVDDGKVFVGGLPSFGYGEGAEFLIWPGSLTTEQLKNPRLIKARMRARPAHGSSNVLQLDMAQNFQSTAGAIRAGDFAQLVKPGKGARSIRVRVRPGGVAGGVPNSEGAKSAIKAALAEETNPNFAGSRDLGQIAFVDIGFDYELAVSAAGRLQIVDPAGRARNAYASNGSNADDLRRAAFDLLNHMQQLSLLSGWKVTGGTMRPNETLEIRLVPLKVEGNAGLCVKPYDKTDWAPATPNAPVSIPLCAVYRIEARLAPNASVEKATIGGAILNADGSIIPIPGDKAAKELVRGRDWTSLGAFQATVDSLFAEENLFMLALPVENVADGAPTAIPWRLLETPEWRAGSRQVEVGDSGKTPMREYGTYTIVKIRTIANPDFAPQTTAKVDKSVAQSREYTVPAFDLSPYMPDDPGSALHKVLTKARSLSDGPNAREGAPYTQHDWCQGSDAKNLDKGIDCSRSIWFAFTRAGLPYNRYAKDDAASNASKCVRPYDPKKDGYVYTGDMVDAPNKPSLMNDNFESCLGTDASAFKLGDVLVYRDATKGDGHTVMVIDPEKRVAWGSHGWDGNPKDRTAPVKIPADTGVEFQKIKFKSDWARWDRPKMELVACWRHKSFVSEAQSGRGAPGLKALCETLRPAYRNGSICGALYPEP